MVVVVVVAGVGFLFKKAFKVAFVLVHSLEGTVGARFKEHHHTMKTIHAEARKHHADTFVMVPNAAASTSKPLSFAEKAMLKMAGYAVREVDWMVPPAAHSSMPAQSECTPTAYMHLHALSMDAYDVVVMINLDMMLVGELKALIGCAAQNRFLSVSGPTSPISQSIFALKPERKLFAAALDMASRLQLSPSGGDSDNVWGDETGAIPKRDCSAGFFWALYYSQRYAPVAQAAISKHGAGHPYKPACSPGACEKVPWRPKAYSIDRCVWGRTENDQACAAKHSSCAKVAVAHAKACNY